MLFKPEHIDKIRAGEKTVTRRDWERPQVREGGVYMATTEMFTSHDEADCYIRVTDHYTERLGDISEEQARREGRYSLEEFREAWERINGDWDPDLEVHVVEFEYVGRERPAEEVADASS